MVGLPVTYDSHYLLLYDEIASSVVLREGYNGDSGRQYFPETAMLSLKPSF